MAGNFWRRPVGVSRKIAEATSILRAIGLPRAQQNKRSALTLLCLLDLKPRTPWSSVSNPLIGITPMMDFFAKHYGQRYAPNSRETVRRFTVHQFEQAGIIVKNPDRSRAINSPDNVYQIESGTLNLLRTFGAKDWEKNLSAYATTRRGLRERYAAERLMRMVPVNLPNGGKIVLSPGGQNILIKEIIDHFCPRFTPGAQVLYIGDAGDKFAVWERSKLVRLGVDIDQHGKMPDVVIYYLSRRWLVLIEAVTSHGPMSAKRHHELRNLFKNAKVGLVFVTAFLDRRSLGRFLSDIAWETEVWVAESPSHLIHFDGEKFLGPYE
jgi:hypothetical protein